MGRMLYSERPSKHVERLMIVEACRRLERIAALDKFRYLGFGGLEFVDFDLFHRRLGILELVSIERDYRWPDRYAFNRPFQGIELRFGESSQVLPELTWESLQIVWLDYSDPLTKAVLLDCETVVRNAPLGSVLLVTMNAHSAVALGLESLQTNVGDELVPDSVTATSLNSEWGLADAQYKILCSELLRVASQQPQPVALRQFLNFRYRDDAKMQTVGWILSGPGLDQLITESGICELPMSRTGEDAFVIKLPVLTRREVDHLNQRLPLVGGAHLAEPWLEQVAQDRYAELYRWYPPGLGLHVTATS